MHGFSHQPSDMLKSELWKSFKLHMILTSDLAPSKRPPKPTELKPISGHQTCHCYLLSLLLLMEEIRRSPVEFGSLSVIPLFTRFYTSQVFCRISSINRTIPLFFLAVQTQVLSKLAFKADFWMQVCRLLSAQHQGSAVFVWKKGGSVLPIFATPWSFDHRKRTLKIGFLSPLHSDWHISEPKKWSSLFVCIFPDQKITHHYQSQTHEDATTQSTCFKIRRKCGVEERLT